MRNVLKIFLLLFFPLFSCDEYKWTYELGKGKGQNQARIVHKSGSDYYILGNNNFNDNKQENIIIKLNQNGENEWEYVFRDLDKSEDKINITDFVISTDNTIYATGNQWISKNEVFQAVIYIIKEGELIESKTFPEFEKMEAVIMKNSKLAILATTYNSKTILSLNNDLTKNWDKKIQTSTSTSYLNYFNNFYYFIAINPYPYELKLLKLNLEGLVIWERTFNIENLGEIYNNIKKNPTHYFLPNNQEIINNQIILTGYNRNSPNFDYLILDCVDGEILKAKHTNLEDLKIVPCDSKLELLKAPSGLLNKPKNNNRNQFESQVVFQAFDSTKVEVCYCSSPKLQDEKFGINDFIIEDSLFVGFKIMNSNYDQKWKINKY